VPFLNRKIAEKHLKADTKRQEAMAVLTEQKSNAASVMAVVVPPSKPVAQTVRAQLPIVVAPLKPALKVPTPAVMTLSKPMPQAKPMPSLPA
jgi:hypothetical protein